MLVVVMMLVMVVVMVGNDDGCGGDGGVGSADDYQDGDVNTEEDSRGGRHGDENADGDVQEFGGWLFSPDWFI